jgi:micrococcal nuclease
MRRWIRAIIVLVIALWAVSCDNLQTPQASPKTGTGIQVRHVVDGDTIELADNRQVRYLGINTPERDQPFYEEAKQFNANLVSDKLVQLEFDMDTIDRYGRTLAHVFVGGTHVNLELIRQGYANVYTVPPNLKYNDAFLAAEREAREHQRGLWAQSSTPIRITALDPHDEWVELTNVGGQAINLTGHTLKDEANHIYTFPNFTLTPNQSVRLYTGNGRNTDSRLYWGLGNNTVWNNNGDTAYLRDPDGSLVDLYTY